jgi:AcrR family transcriptional regulator
MVGLSNPTAMEPPIEPKEDRGAGTRAALVSAAGRLFAERGYEDVSIDDVLGATGLSRGALYHHFAGKAALFEAVVEAVEAAGVERLVAASRGVEDPEAALRAGCRAWLELVRDPAVRRVTLIDAPAVLGWERWRAIDERNGMGLLRLPLRRLAAAGRFDPTLVDGFAHMLLAALGEVALVAARADDGVAATREAQRAIDALLERLLAPQGGA